MTNSEFLPKTGVSLGSKAHGAFLAAAIGDALGWPQEDRSSRIGRPTGSVRHLPLAGFEKWERRAGGRFYSHEEQILAGEYSDDTQLLLCTARSLLHGTQWWAHLTKRELPTWSLYERGGGRATKHAVEMWLSGREPWAAPQKENRKSYFDAGGNGVAMRIMPHCLLGASEKTFEPIARDIFANGICTHGHPRALVGALVYGFAVWTAFRETDTLPYGGLIERVLAAKESWAALPAGGNICPTWRRLSDEESGYLYEKAWEETVAEIVHLLEKCSAAMKQGSLSIDQETLAQLGCFSKKINGAGTVAAAAAIFLASRYAADPLHGIVEAAFSEGADTDTIASMTGGILGALLGSEWLEGHAERVQDSLYFKTVAGRLAKGEGCQQDSSGSGDEVTKARLDSFFNRLRETKIGGPVLLPDGREARVSALQPHKAQSRTPQVVSWKLVTDDGQSLYVKKISRGKADSHLSAPEGISSSFHSPSQAYLQPVEIGRIGVKLPVRDIGKARLFYEKALGFKVEKEFSGGINFDSGVMLRSVGLARETKMELKEVALKSATLAFKTRSLDAAYKNVTGVGATILTELSRMNGGRLFRCLDPDGNVIELFD